MLVLTLYPGDSIQAEGLFEVLFAGADEHDQVVFEIVTTKQLPYRIHDGASLFSDSSVEASEQVALDILHKHKLIIAGTEIIFEVRNSGKVKIVCTAGPEVHWIRPRQHGGSLIAR